MTKLFIPRSPFRLPPSFLSIPVGPPQKTCQKAPPKTNPSSTKRFLLSKNRQNTVQNPNRVPLSGLPSSAKQVPGFHCQTSRTVPPNYSHSTVVIQISLFFITAFGSQLSAFPPSPCQAQQTPALWDEKLPVPKSAELLPLEDVEFHVIKHRVPEQDGYNWLHGVALAWHNNLLITSFGHNAGKENTASEVANGRISTDNGSTWGPVFQIDDGEEENLAVSHGVFLSHEEKLWAFQGAFYNKMEQTHTRAYLFNEKTKQWQKLGVVIEDGFWPMQEPLLMNDGNYIMAGIVAKKPDIPGNPAAVAISHGTDFTKWELVVIPRPDDLRMWGESTVIVDGSHITNIARYHSKPLALVSESNDYGRIWTPVAESNLPMTTSKPYAGTLSTGQRYLVCTTTADSGKARSPLTIAVTRPGEKQFSRIYKIRDAVHHGPGESHPQSRLSYPYAIEHNEKLYVGYSNSADRGSNKNSAELAIIPNSSLNGDKDKP